jgi:hypothetical protein
MSVYNIISYFDYISAWTYLTGRRGTKITGLNSYTLVIEPRDPPRKYTREELAEKIETVKDYVPRKNPAVNKRKRPVVTDEPTWHLKANLHDLSYWSEQNLAHNLDLMHIEKNICDNIVGTLIELEGKNKDTVNARVDLENMKFKKKLWMNDEGDVYSNPHAPWTLEKENTR